MSLIIKGMDMPENCLACPCCNPYPGTCLYCGALNGLPGIISPDSGRLDDCPLAEIPTPHGRLIDADELLKNHAIIADKELINLLYRGTLRKMIDKAPTIIEAEVSE